MPVVRFIRGVVFKLADRAPGDEVEVTEREAHILCDGYQDAVRVDGVPAPQPRGMTTHGIVETRDPVAEHRDPVVKPSKRVK